MRLLVPVAALSLAGCSAALETDQARLCRMALPALMPEGAEFVIVSQRPDPDGRGLTVAFTAASPGEKWEPHTATCRFRAPGRPRESRDLVSMTLDGAPLSGARLYFLIRYWLATPEGRAADPAPLGRFSGVPELPRGVAYGLQMALDGLPLSAIYALLAAAYSLIYGLIGRINFAFGELAAAGGYAAAMTALAMVGIASCAPACGGLHSRRCRRRRLGLRLGARRFHSACVEPRASRRWWRRSASPSSSRSSCESRKATGRAG